MSFEDDTIRVPEIPCPQCGQRLDSVSALDGLGKPDPKPGNLVVCLNCGMAATMENGRIRPFTSTEIEDLLCNEKAMHDLTTVWAGIRFFHADRHRRN